MSVSRSLSIARSATATVAAGAVAAPRVAVGSTSWPSIGLADASEVELTVPAFVVSARRRELVDTTQGCREQCHLSGRRMTDLEAWNCVLSD